jgi:NLI interacting factor-like phosphatase
LAERVFEFLEWASRLFDISICSLGDQQYVDMVCQVLNTENQIIRSGVAYSARVEYLYLSQTLNSRKPPKDLRSLFAYYDIQDERIIPIEPIILDDNAGMWASNQQDNIIVNSCLNLDNQRNDTLSGLECVFISCG